MTATQNLIVDARAELATRARRGQAPLDPYSHPIVHAAIRHALDLAHLAELRPFGDWVRTALVHKNRAGTRVPPPCARPEALSLNLPTPNHELAMLATTAFHAAGDHGVQSLVFASAAKTFVAAWERVTVEVELMTPPPAHPEIDFFKHGLAHLLATFLADESPDATTLALILAAIGTDDPIVRSSEFEPTVDAIAIRASRYKDLWQRNARRARTARERYISVPGRPALLRSGKPSRLKPPFVYLPDGDTVAHRPTDIPPRASVTIVRRGGRRWFYARWNEQGRRRSVPLAPVEEQERQPVPATSLI